MTEELLKQGLERLKQTETQRLAAIQQKQDRLKAVPPRSYVRGWADGFYKVSTLGQNGASSTKAITNGVLGIGDRVVRSGNLIDAMPRVRVEESQSRERSKVAGIIMWLDSDWYATLNFVSLPPMDERNIKFATELLRFARTKRIYTLSTSDPRVYPRTLYNDIAQSGAFGPALTELGIEVIEVANIADANGVFFLQILNPEARLTDAEFTRLRTLAKRNIIFISGEWESWVEQGFNEHLFRGLRLPARVKSTTYGLTFSYTIRYREILKKLDTNIIRGNAAGFFTGLKADEILAANGGAAGPPVFAYFKAD